MAVKSAHHFERRPIVDSEEGADHTPRSHLLEHTVQGPVFFVSPSPFIALAGFAGGQDDEGQPGQM
jgi:hypothetical protein